MLIRTVTVSLKCIQYDVTTNLILAVRRGIVAYIRNEANIEAYHL